MSGEYRSPYQDIPDSKDPEITDEAIAEKAKDGDVLELISQIGWERYRKILEGINYSEIMDRVLEKRQASASESHLTSWMVQQDNSKAHVRALELKRKLELNISWKTIKTNMPEDFIYGYDGGTKLYCDGRKANLENKIFGRRIYLDIPIKNSPEIYQDVIRSFTQVGILGQVDTALNLENFDNQSLGNYSADNAMVIYVYGDKPELMTKICSALENAKLAHPNLWKMPEYEQQKANEGSLSSLKIPLSQNVEFVEIARIAGNSWDVQLTGRVFGSLEIYNPSNPKSMSLEYVRDMFATENPQNPRRMLKRTTYETDNQIDPNIYCRNRHMPALVADEAVRAS